MAIKPGNGVGVFVGTEPARLGVVLRVTEKAGNAEPLLNVAIPWVNADGLTATMGSVLDVPHIEDAPECGSRSDEGHYRWNYSGPEVLVRKALPAEGEPDAGSG